MLIVDNKQIYSNNSGHCITHTNALKMICICRISHLVLIKTIGKTIKKITIILKDYLISRKVFIEFTSYF